MKNTKSSFMITAKSFHKMLVENHIVKLLFLFVLAMLSIGVFKYISTYASESVPACACNGNLNALTLRYIGTASFSLKVEQDDKANTVILQQDIHPGDVFSLSGSDLNGTFGKKIYLLSGNKKIAKIYTDCKKDVVIGYIADKSFVIVDASSRYGGPLCPPNQGVCGNTLVEKDEECDLGDLNGKGRSCKNDCTWEEIKPACGNSIVEGNEECDLGTLNGGICKNDCTWEEEKDLCGNGTIDIGEECDDSNRENDDGCSKYCKTEEVKPTCGNTVIEAGEECDDGNRENDDGCSKYCKTEEVKPICGNTVIEAGEECDDGNRENDDGCSKYCKTESIKVTICHIPQGNPENMQTITVDENSVNYIAHLSHGDYTGACIMPIEPVCGNSIIESDEQCDDGNTLNGDGCNKYCDSEGGTSPICGNEILEGDEACDDGNTLNGDGCTSSCTIEHGSAPVCGNTLLEIGEQCDDGNLVNEDGCTSSCIIENPSESICGNALLEIGEECDDGNTLNSDACSSVCALEMPDGSLLATPNAGQRPFDTTFSATKTSRAKYLSFDFGDGSSLIENPSFPASHTYIALGTYTGTLIIKNNYQGMVATGITIPQIELQEIITVTSRPVVCGNGTLEAGEECDDGNMLNGDACNDLCTLEIPDGSLLATPNAGQRPFDTTFIASKDSRAKYVSLDLGDGSPLINTPLFPEFYTYTTPGLYTSILTIKNNYAGHIASWATLPEATFQTNVFSSETPLYCGDGHLNGTEQCDDGNITERDGCSSTCTLEAPEARVISTPPYGNKPLTATFTATKDSRAKYMSLNYGDGTPLSTNPIFPISHIYPNLGEYIITLIVRNNYTGEIAYGAALPSIQVHTEDTIAVTLCGNEIKERGEQCDFGGGNGLNLGCTNQCKREIPAANCTVTADQTLVIFSQPVKFTILDVYTGWMSLYSLDFGDHNILTPGSGLDSNQMVYIHSYNISNNTFRSYKPTIYVRNDVAYRAGDLVVGSCSQNIVSIGQDYSWLPMNTVIVNTGHSAISTITGDVSIAGMLFPSIIFNTSQLFVLNGSQPLTTIYNPGQILLSDGTTLNVVGGVVVGDAVINPQWIIKVGALDQGGFTFDVRASSGAAWMQQNTYILGPSGRGGEVKPPVQTENKLQFGGTDTTLLFTKPVQLIIEGFVANEVNPPKYKSEGQTDRHDITTICNTPYGIEPSNIVLFGSPQECYQTNTKNTMIRTYHSTEFIVPREDEIRKWIQYILHSLFIL